MLSNIKYIIFIFLTINLFASVNFTDPTSTPPPAPQTSPDLSNDGKDAELSQIVTSSTGQYVYAIWDRYSDSGSYHVVQVAISSNYGVDWVDPTSTPPPAPQTPPDLSKGPDPAGGNSYRSSIATSSTGQYVYALWGRNDGSKYIIQTVRSADYGVNWVNPTSTPGGTPDLSVGGQNAYRTRIITNATGQYVYATWRRYDGSRYLIQVAISSDYGDNWVDPTSTTGNTGTPNLSDNGQDSTLDMNPLATNSTGQYVYATWQRKNDGTNNIIQVAISSDYGDNWVDPTTTTGTSVPNLSLNNRDAQYPQAKTNSTGRYVYVTWQRKNDGTNYIIQVALSSNYGVDWVNPTTTTGDGGTPNLSNDGKGAKNSQITTSSTGQYVYAIWTKTNGCAYAIQLALSSDYGDNWIDPTTLTGSCGINLSSGCCEALYPQIATSSTGQYVYAIWERYDGDDYIIQVTLSLDYGISWQNPTTTTGDGEMPNLSDNGEDAELSQIAISSNGKYIYTIWDRYDGSNYIVQSVNGIDTLAGITLQVSGSQVQIRFPFQIDVINKLVWNNLPETLSYKIYTNVALTNLLAEISAPTNHYEDNQIKRGERKTYYITWVDTDHHEHEAVSVTIP